MQKFKRVFHSGRNMKLLEYTIKHDALIDKALHTTEPGVSDEKLSGEEVICSIFAGVYLHYAGMREARTSYSLREGREK